MSDNIPVEIQTEIFKRVTPIKYLLRLRSVSKQWKSLIDSSDFITNHSINQTQPPNLLVRYDLNKFVSIVDDNTFPDNKFPPVVPPDIKQVSNVWMFDCSRGLVCLYGNNRFGKCVVLWNPSIRKSVSIAVGVRLAAVGVAVCRVTSDVKIVRLTRLSGSHTVDWKAEVFTLSSGGWRSVAVDMRLGDSGSAVIKPEQVVIDGVIYWVVCDRSRWVCDKIVSFDSTSEEFGEVVLPDGLAHRKLLISRLNESLVVVNHENDNHKVCDVWVMTKNGFSKLYSFGSKTNDGCDIYKIVGFRKNGQPIHGHVYWRDDGYSIESTLEAYDPYTKHNTDLRIYVRLCSPFMITSYTESLLLLNHSGSLIQS